MSRPQPQFPPPIYEADEALADPMGSPRPQRTLSQEAARQRRLTRRAVRRALRENPDNMFVNQQVYPSNIFLSQAPIQRMPRPSPPVRHQAADPNSKRSRRKREKQERRQRRENIARGWIYGGAKSRRVRRH